MFKTRTSFVALVTLVLMFGVYSFAGDIVYIIKRTMDERVAMLERKVALYDAFFADRGIDLERTYGQRIIMMSEEEHCRRNIRSGVDVRFGGIEVVVPITPTATAPMTPRDAGRYMVNFKDGSKMVIVTFEKTQAITNDFDRGRISTDYYIFHLENGQRVKHPCKNVDDIKFTKFRSDND